MMNFKEMCSCGSLMEVSSSYSTDVKEQIREWRRTHNKHMNAIAKSLATSTKWDTNPVGWTTTKNDVDNNAQAN